MKQIIICIVFCIMDSVPPAAVPNKGIYLTQFYQPPQVNYMQFPTTFGEIFEDIGQAPRFTGIHGQNTLSGAIQYWYPIQYEVNFFKNPHPSIPPNTHKIFERFEDFYNPELQYYFLRPDGASIQRPQTQFQGEYHFKLPPAAPASGATYGENVETSTRSLERTTKPAGEDKDTSIMDEEYDIDIRSGSI